MKTLLVIGWMTLGVALAGCQASVPGGTTFDFAACSARLFKGPDPELVLPIEGWKPGYNYLHMLGLKKDDPRHEAIKKHIDYSISDGVARVVKKKSLLGVIGDIPPGKVSGGFSRVLKLPHTNGGSYRIAMRYKGWTYRTRNTLLFTPVNSKIPLPASVTAPGDMAPGLRELSLGEAYEWKVWESVVRVPEGCDEVHLVMVCYGIGELAFKDFSLEPLQESNPVILEAFPADLLDQTFACGAGQCALACWKMRKAELKDQFDMTKFTYVLMLPKGWSCVDSPIAADGRITSRAQADGSTEYRLPARNGYTYLGINPNPWSVLSVLLKAETDAPEGEMLFFIEYDGKRLTNVTRTRVFTIPAVKVSARPKRYANGFWTGGPYAEFRTKEGREGFADMFTDAGATWVVQSRPDPALAKLWRSKGVTRIVPDWYYCADGYRIGDWDKRPAEEKLIAIGKSSYQKNIDRSTCPVCVYEESKFFREQTLPALKRYLEGADCLWSNWEPYMFTGNGCVCPRCRSAFAKYVGVSDAEMAKDWPKEIAEGGKWHDKAVRFRSLEHAKVVRTIDRYVRQFTGGENSLGFIPGVAWYQVTSNWRGTHMCDEFAPIDYAGSLKWIDPWAPYPCWDTSAPYTRGSGDLCYFVAAKDIYETVRRDYGKNAPKLLSLPHGVQSVAWITQPESIALAFDSYFFNGWGASAPYHFPKGYDARYWRAFAEATERAAKYEDIVWDGIRCDEKVVLTLDPSKPYCGLKNGMYPKYLVKHDGISYLQHAAYEKDGKRIVAVLNFESELPAYFTLQAKGLAAGAYTVDGRTVTADELAAGIPQVVGAYRTKVLEIVPTGK